MHSVEVRKEGFLTSRTRTQVRAGEQTQLITGALQALPEDGREAMILFYREGQSIAQVAEALDVSEDVVKKRLSRARERIRQSVESALGAALVATIPTGDFSASVLGHISRGAFLLRPKSLSKW